MKNCRRSKKAKKDNKLNDKSFLKEIERRNNELITGKVKGYTWEQVKSMHPKH